MSYLPKRGQSGRLLTAVLVGLVWAVPAPPVRAAEVAKAAGSLQWIPADAAFYATMLRTGEQIEAIAKSRAWAKIKSLPFVQDLWQKVLSELTDEEGKFASLYQWYKKPENRQLVELLGDMFSTEIFVYGGKDCTPFTKLVQETIGAVRYGPIFATLSGKVGDLSPNELRAKLLIEALAENLDAIKVPDMVIGFKLSKADRAQAQLKRLEELAKTLAKKEPRLKGRLKWQKVKDNNFLTLQLDGGLVPWDEIPFKDFEEKEGQYDPLIKKLKQLKLTFALGIRDGYLLLSLGESTAPLTRLGQGQLLADRKELKPLAQYAGKRLTSISYLSQPMHAEVGTTGADIDGMLEWATSFLPDSLTDKQRKQIDKDVKDLGKDLKQFLPKPGPVLSLSFLNSRGYESYQYDWSTYPRRDGSKPLTLLNHGGGSPLLVTVERTKVSPDQYQMLVKWIKVAYRYFEEYGVPNLDEDARDKYQEFAKTFGPLFKRMDQATAKMLLPALADGQMGFVLDGKLKSKQWHKILPESAQPLPLPELALIAGVSDAALLRKAFGEYRVALNAMLKGVHDIFPDHVPELKIPPPKTAKVKDGTLYFYPFPEDWGVDARILPNGGLGEKVATLSLSKEHSQRLLARTPLKVNGGPLADLNRPLAEATYVNFAGLVDMAAPWIDYATWAIAPRLMGLDLDDADDKVEAHRKLDPVMKQVHTVLEVLKVFRSYASVTYLQDGVWVTHSETVIRDLPEEK
jgi:hypothetical protein